MPLITHKTCRRCLKELSVEEFYTQNRGHSPDQACYWKSRCKTCETKEKRDRYRGDNYVPHVQTGKIDMEGERMGIAEGLKLYDKWISSQIGSRGCSSLAIAHRFIVQVDEWQLR